MSLESKELPQNPHEIIIFNSLIINLLYYNTSNFLEVCPSAGAVVHWLVLGPVRENIRMGHCRDSIEIACLPSGGFAYTGLNLPMSFLSHQNIKVPGKALTWSKNGLLNYLVGLLGRKERKLVLIPVRVG